MDKQILNSDVTILGHIAKDIIQIDGKSHNALGGAVFYGGIAGSHMGLKMIIITKLNRFQLEAADKIADILIELTIVSDNYLTANEDAWRKAIYMRANMSCGHKPRDSWLVMSSPHHFHDTTDLQRKLGIFAQTCISLFESTEKKIELI